MLCLALRFGLRFCLALLDEAWFRYEFDGFCVRHMPIAKHGIYEQQIRIVAVLLAREPFGITHSSTNGGSSSDIDLGDCCYVEV
jgi:hypothetical protein